MRLSEKISNDTLSTSILHKLNEADESITEYRYITNHGLGPGTIPEDVELVRWEDLDNGKTAIYLSRPLTDEELNKYDIKPEWIQETDVLTEEYDEIVQNMSHEEHDEVRNNNLYRSIVNKIDNDILDIEPDLAIKILHVLKGDIDLFIESAEKRKGGE